jgi:serine-type D-Ala-D-Ala carboxypeptidase/endopeptidase (penicillin-binding protein 4)
MRKLIALILSTLFAQISIGQKNIELCKQAYQNMCKGADMKYSLCSFVVQDVETGKTLINYNGNVGMPAASTQKLLTAIAVLDAKQDRNLQTVFTYDSNTSTLSIQANADPTLGSFRFANTNADRIMDSVIAIIGAPRSKQINIAGLTGLSVDQINSGWIFEDIATYYGIAAQHFNWRENQFEIKLGKDFGAKTKVISVEPSFMKPFIKIDNRVTIAGTTDETKVFFDFDESENIGYIITGTIGENLLQKNIGVGIAPDKYFICELGSKTGLLVKYTKPAVETYNLRKNIDGKKYIITNIPQDSILRQFIRKSINLYGDALMIRWKDSIAKNASPIHDLATKIGIDKSAIHIFDACGLSPQNRITTNTLTSFLQYARKRPRIYDKLYEFLPTIDGIKMKSGSIHGVKAYAGYITDKQGKQYIFAINANNYSCSTPEMQAKLFTVLHTLQ